MQTNEINTETLASISAKEINARFSAAKDADRRQGYMYRGERYICHFSGVEILAIGEDGERLDNSGVSYDPLHLSGSGHIAKKDIVEHVAESQRELDCRGKGERVAAVAISTPEYAYPAAERFSEYRSDYDEPTGEWVSIEIRV